jgi:hypothetical protein
VYSREEKSGASGEKETEAKISWGQIVKHRAWDSGFNRKLDSAPNKWRWQVPRDTPT